jgi:hypothetical protein
MGKALEGECTEGVKVNSRLAGDRLEIRVGTDVVFIPFIGTTRGFEWNLRLSKDVPFALDLETGANQSFLDLRDVRVASLRLQTGASSTDLTLPWRCAFARNRAWPRLAWTRAASRTSTAFTNRRTSGLHPTALI